MEMREKIHTIILSAIVSGTVAFGVVWVNETMRGSRTPDSLALRTLEISDAITIRSPDSAEEAVVLRNDGLIYSKGKIISEHLLGKQFSGHLFLGNRVLVSPDDLVGTPGESLRFLGEFGINAKTGSGELLIRSPSGAGGVATEAKEGRFAQVGFDHNDLLHFFVYDNINQETQFVANQTSNGKILGPERTEATAVRSELAPPVAEQIQLQKTEE